MLEAIGAGLASLTPTVLVVMVLGVLFCQFIVVIPGLGALFALAMLLPFTYEMESNVAITLVIAVAATSGTGNTITGVLLGVPGSSVGVATLFDGYPMAKRGEAGRALGAGLTASAVGGLFGAVVLIVMIPLVRLVVTQLGPAEFFALILIALVLISKLGQGETLKGLVMGGIGLLLAFVGQEPSTGTLRYTYGTLYLWEGIELVPAIIGLFAVTEMINLIISGSPIAGVRQKTVAARGVLEGMRDVFRHWRITLACSAIGSAIGLLPGIGGMTAQFVAYGQAQRMSKDPSQFGKGAIEGVIGPDAANNSVEGGALVPTLVFGIPGGSVMALVLGALIIHGVQPGPELLNERLDVLWLIIFVLILSNLVAAGFCLSFANWLARITHVRPSVIVPFVLLVGFFGAYLESRHLADLVVVMAFGLLGYAMQRFGYSRATLVIGLVLGSVLEHNYLLAMRLYGWDMLRRPPFLAILLATGAIALLALLRRRGHEPAQPQEKTPAPPR